MSITLPGRKWKPPQFSTPQQINAGELHPLGLYRGTPWYSHRLGELELKATYREDDPLPNAPLVQDIDADGIRTYRAFRIHAPGTFEAIVNAVPKAPKPRPAHRVVDALGNVPLANRQAETIVSEPADPVPSGLRKPLYIKPPAPAARGPEAIIARLRKKGARVALSADRAHIVVTASAGRPGPGVRDLVTAAAPLLLAYLRDGKAPPCVVSGHGGKPPEAVTIALGTGAAWCGRCIPEV